MPANPRPEFGPQSPVRGANKQDRDANHGEDIIRVSVRVPVPLGRDEGHDGQEGVAEDKDDCDGQMGVPSRGPVLLLVVV